MRLTFKASSITAEHLGSGFGSRVEVTAEDVSGRDVAEALSVEDRLYGIRPVEILAEVSAEEMLIAIGEEQVSKWLQRAPIST